MTDYARKDGNTMKGRQGMKNNSTRVQMCQGDNVGVGISGGEEN